MYNYSFKFAPGDLAIETASRGRAEILECSMSEAGRLYTIRKWSKLAGDHVVTRIDAIEFEESYDIPYKQTEG